ncbi:hypothetical protein, partial [Brachyspira intermedia]|uniref:hypothetical protein n=1 Tax=Brachyspira intermedia TaxID=84377 RepID=UPI003004175B
LKNDKLKNFQYIPKQIYFVNFSFFNFIVCGVFAPALCVLRNTPVLLPIRHLLGVGTGEARLRREPYILDRLGYASRKTAFLGYILYLIGMFLI